ncbi:TPA: SGNH/GDSL hydrolase family protein [Streptococcus suis]|nr:SGNH/GDSL hydrolase family protein [Streptococcus suis]
MSGIDKHLEIIKNGVFGREVRQAIHDGIQQAYTDATIEHGNTDMEVAKARGEFHELSARLSNFEGVVNAKADEAEIKSMLSNILDGSPKGTYSNMSALRQAHPNGTQGIFITTDNNNWNYWNGSDWVAGGVYQANMAELSAKQLTEGKANAYLQTRELAISFDGMWIAVKGATIVDGVNNIWPPDYEGILTNPNGFLVYNKATKKFDMSPIERFDKDNIILGFFWADGSGRVNSIARYDVQKNGIWKTYNIHQIKTAVLIGGGDITISNYTFSEIPKVQMDFSGKKVEWNVSSPEITRVNNTNSGYILFDSVSKTFSLKSIESDLKKEPETVFYVATMWSNGYYTENGALKNPRKESANANKTASGSRVVTLGDSITQGLKSYKEPRELFDKAWPNYMLEYYGGSLRNLAVSGRTLAGSGPDDFNGQVSKVNFADFDLAIIAMGVNDFNYQNNISDTVSGLRRGLDKMFSDNKNLQVAGILPHNLFRLPFTNPANTVYVDGLNFADRNGKTLNDFCDALAEVYKEYQIPYIDWRKAPVLTLRNYNKWTWDAIHPNEAGHALIGRRVAEWLKVNV